MLAAVAGFAALDIRQWVEWNFCVCGHECDRLCSTGTEYGRYSVCLKSVECETSRYILATKPLFRPQVLLHGDAEGRGGDAPSGGGLLATEERMEIPLAATLNVRDWSRRGPACRGGQ